jgi:uncharacterized protein
MLRFGLTCSAAFLLMGCAAEAEGETAAAQGSAYAASAALELTGRVVDAADIFSTEFEENLSVKLAQLETDTGVQLVVVSTPDLGGRDVSNYTNDLANAWGIGSEERDDGLVVLVAPNERKVRIEVGLGLEASIEDEEALIIITDDMTPQFQNGDYEAGIDAGVDSLIREVTPIELREAA